MTCTSYLGRQRFAREFYPARRPLFVRCGSCKMRRASRWHVVKSVGMALLFVAFMFGPVVWAAARKMGKL